MIELMFRSSKKRVMISPNETLEPDYSFFVTALFSPLLYLMPEDRRRQRCIPITNRVRLQLKMIKNVGGFPEVRVVVCAAPNVQIAAMLHETMLRSRLTRPWLHLFQTVALGSLHKLQHFKAGWWGGQKIASFESWICVVVMLQSSSGTTLDTNPQCR